MKAAIYCRLSREDDDHDKESESIQNQRSMLVQYAQVHGYAIAGIYCDEDYSGADRARPAFNRMLAAAQRREFDTILVKTQSRFTRDLELAEKYLHGKFVEWGIRFIAVVDHVDTSDAAGKKSRQINALINEWYLEDLSANVRSVLDHKRRQGQYIASAPLYGYRKDPADKNRLLPDPPAAAVVRRIFALYLAGQGAAAIARILNEEGVPTPSQYKGAPNPGLWNRGTIHRMLRTRTYAGDLEQGRHKRVSYKSKKTIWLPRDAWVVVPNTHEALIPRADFDRVQALLAARGHGGPHTGAPHPLAGKAVCALCGAVLEQTGGGAQKARPPRRYLRCRTARQSPACCPGQPYLPLAELEALVLDRLCAHTRAAGSPPPPALTRPLAQLLVDRVAVYPPEAGVRRVKIIWRF